MNITLWFPNSQFVETTLIVALAVPPAPRFTVVGETDAAIPWGGVVERATVPEKPLTLVNVTSATFGYPVVTLTPLLEISKPGTEGPETVTLVACDRITGVTWVPVQRSQTKLPASVTL